MPPTEVPGSRLTFAMFTDPEGHLIGLPTGAVPVATRAAEQMLVIDKSPEISDEYMRGSRANVHGYTIAILKKGPAYDPPRSDAIISEHGRRNLALHIAGVLSIMCPVRDGGNIAGVGIYNAEPEGVDRIMAGDPAIQAGVLTFEVHPAIGSPGDCLPRPAVTRAD